MAPSDLDLDAIGSARVFWATVTGLCAEPSRSATLAALEAAEPCAHTVLDLDWRPMFWDSPDEARGWVGKALEHADVAVGNQDEVEVAVGAREPRKAAELLLDKGVRLAIVKQGPAGVLAVDDHGEVELPPAPVDVVNGLGAGDAFGGALVHGLLAERDLTSLIAHANAAGAIVAGRLACSSAMPTAQEVEAKLRRPPMRGELATELSETRLFDPEAIARAAERRRRAESPVGSRGSASSSRPTTRRGARWAPAGTRWRWPTGATCSTGSAPRWPTPAATGCWPPPTSSRTCCCSMPWTASSCSVR
ncbi:hypothetical protein GCM10029992_41200 [Glycomyces albus]